MKTHGTKDNAKPSERSDASYPIYALEEAVKVGQAVKELGGARQAVSKKMLAKQMSLHESGPSFFQRVAASKYFGIIEGRGNYTLSETARRHFYPQQAGEEKKALLDLLKTPPLFAKVIARFDGDTLPAIRTSRTSFMILACPTVGKIASLHLCPQRAVCECARCERHFAVRNPRSGIIQCPTFCARAIRKTGTDVASRDASWE